VRCSDCGFDNRQDVKYCTRCGVPLFLFCHKCHCPMAEGDRYCGGCGARLLLPGGTRGPLLPMDVAVSSERQALAQAGPPRAFDSERKHVTVLFADISGFTSMSEKLDPEDVTTVMNGCLKLMAETVVKYEGYVDKFIGDCIMALFGAPVTHENDPELALRAALDMKKEMEDYNKNLPVKVEKPLALHIGINSGIVIAGSMGSDKKMEYTVMGDAVNLASRLESIAGNGQIFVSGYTYNLTRGFFDFIRHDPIRVKGKKDPVAVYEAVKAKPLNAHDLKAKGGTIPLVGRTQEIDILKGCAERLVEGREQAVFLISDPGIGKSRIQVEIKEHFNEAQVQLIEGTCHSFSRTTTYYVFSEIFRGLFNIDSEDLEGMMADKVGSSLPLLLNMDPSKLPSEAREAVVYIGAMMGLDLGEEFDIPLGRMDAQEVKISTFRAVAWVFRTLALRKPLLLVLENLHHADSTSVEMIAYLFESLKDVPVMFLLLMRPSKDHSCSKLPLMARKALGDRATEITFGRLTLSECDQFVRQFLRTDNVPEEVLGLVRNRADGNPLFIEEIVRGIEEGGYLEKEEDGSVRLVKDLAQITIPSSIQGMIIARIDRLPGALKEVLHTACVIGPVFKLALIERVVRCSDMEKRLDRLGEMGLIFESRSFPEVEYSFRNILIQEAVYSTLLHKKLNELHGIVAREIEALYKDRLEEHCEVLAHHYQAAGDEEKACVYLVKSGLKAKAAYANRDAANHLHMALELAVRMPRPPVSMEEVYLALSDVQELVGNMDGAIESLQGAMEVVQDELGKADALRNIGRIHEKRGFKEQAMAVYEEAFASLEGHPDSPEMGMLLMNQSWVLNRMRRYDEALEKAGFALKIFETHKDPERIAQVYNNLAVILEHKGDLDKALEYNLKSLECFRGSGNKRQSANLLLSLGYLHNTRSELETALNYFDESFELMNRIGNRFGAGTALMSKGRCCVDLGKLDEAENALLHALGIHRELDLKRKIVANRLALGNVFLQKGETEKAKEHLGEARRIAREQDYVSDLAKCARLEASALIREGADPCAKFQESVECFRRLGREQEAASVQEELELYRRAGG